MLTVYRWVGPDAWDGWKVFARVKRENLGRTLQKLFALAYDTTSIDVRDEDAFGESVPEADWPLDFLKNEAVR